MATQRDIFQAIADPTRREILNLLVTETMTPTALAEKFPATRQAISKHIRILFDCGLVRTKQVGRERYCEIRPQKLKVVVDWIEPFRRMWEERFNQLDDVLKQMKTHKR